jgi:hypothetical protein
MGVICIPLFKRALEREGIGVSEAAVIRVEVTSERQWLVSTSTGQVEISSIRELMKVVLGEACR